MSDVPAAADQSLLAIQARLAQLSEGADAFVALQAARAFEQQVEEVKITGNRAGLMRLAGRLLAATAQPAATDAFDPPATVSLRKEAWVDAEHSDVLLVEIAHVAEAPHPEPEPPRHSLRDRVLIWGLRLLFAYFVLAGLAGSVYGIVWLLGQFFS